MADNKIDAHLVRHKGNHVLVMTPAVSRVIRAMCGLVTGDGQVRACTNMVWLAYSDLKEEPNVSYFFEDTITCKSIASEEDV